MPNSQPSIVYGSSPGRRPGLALDNTSDRRSNHTTLGLWCAGEHHPQWTASVARKGHERTAAYVDARPTPHPPPLAAIMHRRWPLRFATVAAVVLAPVLQPLSPAGSGSHLLQVRPRSA